MNEGAKKSAAPDVHILWISEGLSCDGDTVSVATRGAARQGDTGAASVPEDGNV
jgi:hypothetical protein